MAARPGPSLSYAEFADAVRQALRVMAHPSALARNPLTRSRTLAAHRDSDAAARALRAVLEKAIESLKADPRTEKFHRVVWHTYVRPASTQEAAAEALSLPFSTYRYQLARGLDQVMAQLWARETRPA